MILKIVLPKKWRKYCVFDSKKCSVIYAKIGSKLRFNKKPRKVVKIAKNRQNCEHNIEHRKKVVFL
jgi:hypothetical protein